MKPMAALLVTLLLGSLAARADELGAADVAACVERTAPEPDSVRSAQITYRDRTGDKTITGVMMYGRRADDGLRQLLVNFVQPEDLRGTALLILERKGENEVYFASSELGETTRITGPSQASQFFGTDLSFEDLQYLEGFGQSSAWKRLDDEELSRRPVYVVEIRPENSAYERIVSRVDKESCLPLNVQFYERRNLVMKELTIDGSSIRKIGAVWVPHSVLMRDRREGSTTHIFVDRAQQEAVPVEMFDAERLLESTTRETPQTPSQ